MRAVAEPYPAAFFLDNKEPSTRNWRENKREKDVNTKVALKSIVYILLHFTPTDYHHFSSSVKKTKKNFAVGLKKIFHNQILVYDKFSVLQTAAALFRIYSKSYFIFN